MVDCYALCEHLKTGIGEILKLPISFINLYQNSEAYTYRKQMIEYEREYELALIKRLDVLAKIMATR